jgi:hypothetical protein
MTTRERGKREEKGKKNNEKNKLNNAAVKNIVLPDYYYGYY